MYSNYANNELRAVSGRLLLFKGVPWVFISEPTVVTLSGVFNVNA